MTRFLYSLLVVLALVAPRPGRAQLLTPLVESRLQAELDLVMTRYPQVKGIAGAVLLPDNSLWIGSAGVSTNTPQVQPLQPDMLFGIASVTKTFTAALIMRLAERGQLRLNDRIGRHLPAWAMVPQIDSTITIRQLLNHTSGMYNHTSSLQWMRDMYGQRARRFSPQELLTYLKPMVSPPGTVYSYNNTGYLLLQIIIEEKTGLPIQTAFRDELWRPNRMTHTYLGYDDVIPSFYEEAHAWRLAGRVSVEMTDQPRTSLFSSFGGAGGVLSNPADMVLWGKALFGGTVVSPASLREMETLTPLSGGALYGLGCTRIHMTGTRQAWGHMGFVPSCLAALSYEPQCGTTIAIVVNDDQIPSIRRNTMRRMYNLVLMRAVCRVVGTDDTEYDPMLDADLSFAPNPTESRAAVSYTCAPSTRTLALRLFDAAGRLVREVALDPTQTRHEDAVANLPAGMYIGSLVIDGTAGPSERLVVLP